MAATVNSVIDRIATVWAAKTAPDDTGTTYHRYAGKYDPEGTASDRAFWFEIRASGVAGQRGAGLTERLWEVRAFLRLTEAGRNMQTFQETIANEMNLLLRAAEEESYSSVSNLIAVETVGAEVDKQENGDVIVEFTINVHTHEVD